MSILDDARAGMDLDVRPQDDLFGHVNGRWLEEVEIPADRSSWGPFVQLADTSEQRVRAIIEGCAGGAADAGTPESEGLSPTEAQQVGDLYASFMDVEAVNARGAEPVAGLLAAIGDLDDIRDLAAFLGGFERTGGPGLFGSYVSTDSRDSDRYLVHLAQGGLGLPDESYYRDEKFAEVRGAYRAHLERMLGLGDHEDPEGAAEAVVALETRIAAGHWERSETRDVQKTYNLLTREEIAKTCPGFDWDAYLSHLAGPGIDPEPLLAQACVRQPSFFEHLSTVLTEEPVGAWRAWLVTRVLRAGAPYLGDEFVEANFDFYGRTLSGTPELRERWKRGVALVEGGLGEAVAKEYVARHFPPRSKAMMDELVSNLLAAYRHSIERLDWMSEETKQHAYDKLKTFRPKIGYPETFRDYSELSIEAGDLFGNVRAVAAHETDRQLRKIGSPVDRDEWFMLPQTVNAYYNPGTNEICFPAGILQKPFFDPDAEPAENYGGIGSVIGHEIGHGFDDQGAQYDGAGNLHDWWTPADKAAFEVKSTALVEQYDEFEPRGLPGERVNGALTVGENIGDLGGLTIGHTAFVLATDGSASPDQRRSLFLNWAYVWRTKRRREQEQQYLAIDPHSPPEFRANIVRNLEEFHEVFATAQGDALWLAPEERVRIW